MKKRILSLLLVLMLVVSLVPMSASAANDVVTYKVTGGYLHFDRSTGAIVDCDTTVFKAVIPSEINGISVTKIGDEAFRWCSELTSLTIPDSVTSIGDTAFWGCTSLTSINIPGSVTSIGDTAFWDCTSLTSVTIQNGVTSIGNRAFWNCTSLTSISIPNSVTSIDTVFYDCTSLVSVAIPDSVTSIVGAFSGCISLMDVAIPDSVTNINGAFSGCTSLASVTIPDSVTSIGWNAFSGCTDLTSVTIPDSVTGISGYAFQNCTNLKSVVIPDGVWYINDYAFQGCTSLKKLTLPSSLELIYEFAFSGCTSLKTLNVPSNVREIDNSAFSGCTALTSVSIPLRLETVGNAAFRYCDSLADVYYYGDSAQWGKMSIAQYNEPLINATRHYNSATHPHSYTAEITAPTCTTQGYTTYTCVCGASYVDGHTDALGHDYKNGVCTRCKTADPDYEPPEWISFVDVPSTEYYYKPVQWAVENGVTTGVGGNKFAPDDTCTRAVVVTLLWRVAGRPAVSANVSFTDVPSTAFYYEAVKWAVANGITTGTGNNKFSPDDTCTRGQVVTFLHRAANKPAASAVSSFSDVQSADFYYDAVNWAVGKGITDGVGNNKFAPNDTCTRGQVVTFLYRAQ